ncbi:MAG: hypothetical protein ACE5JH_11155 [Acidobacteriota bacterium]
MSFARVLLDALGERHKETPRLHARREGIDLDDVFEAIGRTRTGKLPEVDVDRTRIVVRVE